MTKPTPEAIAAEKLYAKLYEKDYGKPPQSLGKHNTFWNRIAAAVKRVVLRELNKGTMPSMPPYPPKAKRAAKAATLALLALLAMPADAATFCDLECLSPGASNQSLCAPLAQQINVDWSAGSLDISYHANNGTLISYVETESVNWSGTIWSNDDSALIAAPLPEWIKITVTGVGGPGRTAVLACGDCAATPEPASVALVGLGLTLAAWRARR